MIMPDLHRPPPNVIGLDDREMEIVHEALRYRKADLVGMHRLCQRLGDDQGRGDYAMKILTLDVVRLKLGDKEDQAT